MVALRSRRLQTLLGASLDELRYEHLEALVANHVPEAFDLDFKRELYGNADKDKRDLATDVAALANTAGGLLVLGIEEDRQARAVEAPGVAVSDDEIRRILQIVGSGVVPLPVFDLLPVLKPGEAGYGFIVIAVARDSLAPHAVIVNQALRYPRRNGTTTRYLSEPEVASAYRERLVGAQRQAARIGEITAEAIGRLDQTSGRPWVVVSLVPDLPGELSINGQAFRAFREELRDRPVTVVPVTGARFERTGVGRRRLLAEGAWGTPAAEYVSLELHIDGSGVFSLSVPSLGEAYRGGTWGAPAGEGEPAGQWVQDETLVIAVMSGLLHLAQHARDRAAAGGNALIRAQIWPIDGRRTSLGHSRTWGFPAMLGDGVTVQPPPAEAAVELDGIAQAGPNLAAATAVLLDEIGQAFGLAEMAQLSRDGQLRRRYWREERMVTWAEQNGIEITEDTIE
jgi:hypothetical protein